MSSDYLKLVPVDPRFVPERAAQKRAVSTLEDLLPEGSECEARDFGHVAFIDQGENFEAILCPACSRRLELHDSPAAETNQAWWGAMIDALEDGDVEAATATMPCCSRIVPLLALTFDWPAGFARFELSILDPGIGENLSKSQLAEFETILGCRLIQVRAHY